MIDVTCPIIVDDNIINPEGGDGGDGGNGADFLWAITAAYIIMISFAYIPIMIMIYTYRHT